MKLIDNIEEILLIGGNNIDKKEFRNIQKKICKDKDIKKLISRGKEPFIISLLVFILGFYLGVLELLDNIKVISNVVQNFSFNLFIAISTIYTTIQISGWIKTVTKNTFNLPKYLKYIFSSKSPKNPLEIWNPINANLSDAQIIIPAERMFNDKVSFIYTGIPYYQIKMIDSITIGWDHNFISFAKEKYRYFKFFTKFAVQTLVGNADEKYYDRGNRKLKVSSFVFGIHFLSRYLKESINWNGFGNKIMLNIDNKIENKEKKEFSRLFIEMCTSPDIFEWKNNSSKNPMLTIFDINFVSEDNKRYYFKTRITNLLKKRIRIPVKRFIAVPLNSIGILPEMYQEGLSKKISILLGGGEQNLALLYLINNYRWTNKSNFNIGIAENVFDDYHNTKFQLGTEELVYGITNEIKGRGLEGKNQGKAEIFSFVTDELRVVSIYGYSAAMTKISALKFLKYIKECQEENIPWKRKEVCNHLLYEVVADGDFYESKVLKEFNKEDMMNSKMTNFDNISSLNIKISNSN
ncbi:hypothetical protein [Sporosalibacterium faouarense]|uniref:hypothetical protein n=1 Tax=Sporosalibacterium faouarense TaxID=516123 RepID=UPI00192B02CE|nr:hypothetical protein [Sporosalibacterium faouarense]